MDNQKLWHKFLDTIKPQVSSANFKTFFSKTKINQENDKIILSTPSAFIEETLKKRHLPLIQQIFDDILGKKVKIEFLISGENGQSKKKEEDDFFSPITIQSSYSLNPKYTLENFVVGPSNNVAFAAAQAVVQNPGTSYNPLFVYGGTGVGKTHLMLAIGNAIFKKKPSVNIIYCSSEKFMNDYVAAIQNHRMIDLRNKYRSAQILLIDDVQFFSGREGTQEEFFHTFNELQSKNSQMIITSDRSPHEIAKLEDRLRSRFAGGLMVDIQPPDFDTRVAILKAKCTEWGSLLPEDTLRLIASSTESSIRELEGRLMQILQILKAQNLEPSSENIALYLKEPQKSLNLNHKQVISAICSYFDLSLKDLTGPKRQKELVLPRHITMYILAEELGMTVEKIGQLLGGRDHTTVMHGRDRIKKQLAKDREIQRLFMEIKNYFQTI
ncbi:chromosomal replication initiator protein DnaA [Candidatus Daviesbacteria bacterium]|nr:chromosomal replication initiator protein DnaA [Candidatus Daviesbacteria bacterium]